jgi:endoglucanase
MNEPTGLPSTSTLSAAKLWEKASQSALTAIRGNGDTQLVMVPGYNWSGAQRWAATHPKAWITDSAHNFRYEAHHYWDRDNSGTYTHSYVDEVANAVSRGYAAS